MAGEYRADGFAVPETLGLLHDLLERVSSDHPEVAREDLMLMETAVVELAANVVEHGRPAGKVSWSFELDVHDDRLEARLQDGGEEVPPAAGEMPDVWSEAGRGLPIARMALDVLDYERVGDRNSWRLVRRRTG